MKRRRLMIITGLLERGASVRAYDPVAMRPKPPRSCRHVSLCGHDEYEAVTDADALVFVTEWNQFRALDMRRVRDLMRVAADRRLAKHL